MQRRAFLRATAAAASAPAVLRSPIEWIRVGQDPIDVDAITGDGRRFTLKGTAIRELSKAVRGRVLQARSPGYDLARQVLNPSIDRRPALIVQPGTVDEVRSAVAFGRANQLLTAVKCGGHSFSGQSTCDLGLQIDLSGLRGVQVQAAAKRARVAGGTLLGQVDRETQAAGLATPLGTVSHTGVGGLTTGGGFGRLARRLGLALDNVTEAEVVVADGTVRKANPTENPDLYWGIRGGGGNFGVVTSFEFALHPFDGRVVAGDLLFPFSRAKQVLELYAEYTITAPEDLYLDFFLVRPGGGGDPVLGLNACYSGPPNGRDKAFAPIRRLGTPIADQIKPTTYLEVQRSGDVKDPRAFGTYLKSGFTTEITASMITAILESIQPHPKFATQLFTQHCGGAINRVAPSATAFPHRYARQNIFLAVAWPAGDDSAEPIKHGRDAWAKIEPHTKGFYTNEVSGEEGKGVVDANYRENYRRMVELKRKYDPTNLFRLNANVRPGP